ncbi:hypothetical protein HMPREF9124_0236 [Oribacterium sp. oral taxon 108 str. F0425]|nr:hypothetical protein HMPREF9124_0236 [Oribacterium sp. oral taxon 108 str. F0425]
MHFTLDDKKGNGGYAIIFATPLLLPARVKAPQDARTPFRVYNCALRKSKGIAIIRCPCFSYLF